MSTTAFLHTPLGLQEGSRVLHQMLPTKRTESRAMSMTGGSNTDLLTNSSNAMHLPWEDSCTA